MLIISTLYVNSVFSQEKEKNETFYCLRDSLRISLHRNVDIDSFEIFSYKEYVPHKHIKWIYWTFCTADLEPTRYIFSEGTIERNSTKIICYDPTFKRYYTFDRIDQYTLVATKHTALFTKGDTLKMSEIWFPEEENTCVLSMNWDKNKTWNMDLYPFL